MAWCRHHQQRRGDRVAGDCGSVIGGANLAGGGGTALGAIIGAMLIEVIRNSLGLRGINAFWQGALIGGAILFAVLFDRLANYRRNS